MYYVKRAREELTDEELENVIGGASREFFSKWAAEQCNSHRKNENDKQIYEKPTRTRND
jgi:bacteriocin-like protein